MSKKRKSAQPRLARVSVQGEVRDEIDWDRFAWAVLQHARHVNRQGAKRKQPAAEDRS